MGLLESFIFGTLSYMAYRKIFQPTIQLRQQCRARLKKLEAEIE